MVHLFFFFLVGCFAFVLGFSKSYMSIVNIVFVDVEDGVVLEESVGLNGWYSMVGMLRCFNF